MVLTSSTATSAASPATTSKCVAFKGTCGTQEDVFISLLLFVFLQNFRSHMNSVSHQQRMMEIQHMSNACLVTLLPRVQESLQGTSKDGSVKVEIML